MNEREFDIVVVDSNALEIISWEESTVLGKVTKGGITKYVVAVQNLDFPDIPNSEKLNFDRMNNIENGMLLDIANNRIRAINGAKFVRTGKIKAIEQTIYN